MIFWRSTLPYFSEKDFAKKYALKEYQKKLEKASWYKTVKCPGQIHEAKVVFIIYCFRRIHSCYKYNNVMIYSHIFLCIIK